MSAFLPSELHSAYTRPSRVQVSLPEPGRCDGCQAKTVVRVLDFGSGSTVRAKVCPVCRRDLRAALAVGL